MGASKCHFVPVHDSRNKHDLGASTSSDSTVGDVQERDVQDRDYGPWLLVSRRRNGHKSPKNQCMRVDKAGPPLPTRTSHATLMDTRPLKDYKRKHTVDPNPFGPNLSKLQANGPMIHMDQTSSNPGIGPAQPSSALGASVKVKKKSSRARASNNSQINLTDKKHPLHLNTTLWKVNGGSSSFNPKFQFTSAVEVGKIAGKSD